MKMTPLLYFGNREEQIKDLLHLLPKNKKYNNCIDPFCGSGSISWFLMSNNIASQYRLNDTYHELVIFHRLVKEDPKPLIEHYKDYSQKIHSANNEADRKQIYNQIKIDYNNETDINKKAISLGILINFAKDQMPKFFQGQFCSNLCEDITLTMPANDFEIIINNLHTLLKDKSVKFDSAKFISVLTDVSQDDLIVMDPPYPSMPNEKNKAIAYVRPETTNELHDAIVKSIGELREKNIDFIMLYGDGDLSPEYQLDCESSQLQHYARLGYNDAYGHYYEHIYLPTSMEIDNAQLPSHIVAWDKIATLSHEKRVEFLITQVKNSETTTMSNSNNESQAKTVSM